MKFLDGKPHPWPDFATELFNALGLQTESQKFSSVGRSSLGSPNLGLPTGTESRLFVNEVDV